MVSIAMWIFPCSGAFPSIHLVRSEYHMQMATTMTRLVCKPKVTWFHVRTTWVLPGPRITRKVVEKNALFPFKLTIIYLWLGAMLIGNLITSLVRLHVETPQFRVCVYIYVYIKQIYIYIYMHIYYLSNLENPRFTEKRTSTNLERSHRLPHVCTIMIYGKLGGYRLQDTATYI